MLVEVGNEEAKEFEGREVRVVIAEVLADCSQQDFPSKDGAEVVSFLLCVGRFLPTR